MRRYLFPRWWSIGVLATMALAGVVHGHESHWPSVHDTVAGAARRLKKSVPVEKLKTLSTDGALAAAALYPEERRILGEGWIRFRVNGPVLVTIAAPAKSVPYWLQEQGYLKLSESLSNADGEFVLYQKRYPAGWVGLGVNGLDRAAATHYAVFLRPEAADAALLVRDIRPGQHRLVTVGPSVSPYLDAEKPFKTLPSVLAGTTFLQTRHNERRATALFKNGIWTTRFPSSLTPDHVVVSFGADPARSLTWTWRTRPEVRDSVIRIAPAASGKVEPDDAAVIRLVRGSSQRIASEGLMNDATIRRHRVTVTGLQPDTAYLYWVGDDSPSGGTPWQRVQTAPEQPRDFGFIYMGDAQNGLDTWGQLIRGAYQRRPDVAFILMAGDLVDRGSERSDWDDLFENAAGVFDRVPLMPCPGNHEYQGGQPTMYRAFFALPRNGPKGIDPGLVYSFEYGNAFVAVLDSNLKSEEKLRVQTEWLDAALAKTKATWKFVMFHHPIYSSHPTRDNADLRGAWVPIFDRHHVDLVLQGHDHGYLRTYPMRSNRRVASPQEGTVYVVSVSGTKHYEIDLRDYGEKGLAKTSTYQTLDIRVEGNRLTYRALDAEGREVDGMVIDKGAPPEG